jgi:hypothetical protein
MAQQRPIGQPAAGIPHGKNLMKYAGTPVRMDRLEDGPDALPMRKVPKQPTLERVDPWTNHAREIAYRLASIENSAVEADVAATRTPNTRLLTFRLDYVGAVSNAKIWTSLLAASTSLISRLAGAGTPFDAALIRPWRLPLASPTSAEVPSILVWRCSSPPIEAGLLVVNLLHDALGVTDSNRVRVRAIEAEQQVLNARMNHARKLEERRQRHTQVLATCERCGRDLRDPTYAAIGIGPECIKSYPSAQLKARRALDQEMRQSSQIHLNAKRPEAWLTELGSRWGLTDLAP